MPEPRHPIITLTTDFGTADHYVSSVKAAILTVSSRPAVVDITHEIPPHDVMEAGWILRNAFGAFPRRTVHVAVCDPGVGTSRRAILAVTENHYFIGPDNGIFSFVFDVEPPAQVIEITATHYLAPTVGATFHARDVFAPAAAHLAGGIAAENFGAPIEDYVRLDLPKAKVTREGGVKATVAHVDRFGNVILNLTRQALEAVRERVEATGFTATAGPTKVAHLFTTYGDAPPGTPFLLYNSSDLLEIAANQARACDLVGLRAGDVVDITFSTGGSV